MILVDHQIKKAIEDGLLAITPYDPDKVNPNSLDLTLSDQFISCRNYLGTPIDPYDKRSISYGQKDVVSNSYTIRSGEFILASTTEKVVLPDNICAELNGKSSLARLGLQIHQTGGWIDCGFSGQITLELLNIGLRPIQLTSGMPIGQIVFHQTEPAEVPYGERNNSKYQNQTGPVASKYYLNKV